MITSAPPTSPLECLQLLALSLAVGLGFYLLVWYRHRRSPSAGYFRTPKAFLVSWFPFLFLALGFVGISLLRDHGHVIFPWLLGTNCLLGWLWMYLSRTLQAHFISRAGVEAQADGGSAS